MSKLRRGKAASKYRSVECRHCHRPAVVLDGSKLGYDAPQWQCRNCGWWNSFSPGVGEVTLDRAIRATEPPKLAAATAAMSAPHRGHRIEVLRVVEPENGSARFVIQWE